MVETAFWFDLVALVEPAAMFKRLSNNPIFLIINKLVCKGKQVTMIGKTYAILIEG
jgi:hypothetical protein